MGFDEAFSEKFSDGALTRGVSRRCLERPVGEYDACGVCPIEERKDGQIALHFGIYLAKEVRFKKRTSPEAFNSQTLAVH